MFLSIIVPVYNSRVLLEEFSNKLFNHLGVADYEVIFVDGGSNDGTVDVLNAVCNKQQNSFFVSEPDEGIYDAMNKGVNLSKGQFVYFIGCDDMVLFGVDDLKCRLNDENVVYYGNVVLMDSNRIYNGPYSAQVLINENICHQSIFYPRHILKSYPYNLKYRLLADYALNIKLWRRFKFIYLNMTVAEYSNSGLSTQVQDLVFRKDFLWIIYKALGLKLALSKVILTLRKRVK